MHGQQKHQNLISISHTKASVGVILLTSTPRMRKPYVILI